MTAAAGQMRGLPLAEARAAATPGFPYRLIYWTEGDYSLVVAIAHSKRRPGYWKGRVRPST
jgi:hypothetical protein